MRYLVNFEKHKFYSNINELMLEAKIVLNKDLVDILKKVDNKVSKEILGLMGKDVDTNMNYFDTAAPNDNMLKYLSGGNKPRYIITNPGKFFSHIQLFQLAGLEGDWYGSMRVGDTGTVIRTYTHEDLDKIQRGSEIAHFIEDNGEHCFIGIEGIQPLGSNKYTEARIGRIVRKLLTDAGISFTDKDIEEFVNDYKTRVDIINDKFRLISIVSGEDIKKSYLYTNNISKGQLGKSCMRHQRCQDYFGIYVENPDICQLLILKDEDTGLVSGRALLWTLVDGRKYLDRAYATNDNDISLFESYANEQGWLYLTKNSYVIYPSGESVSKHRCKDILVKLKNYYFDEFPYMDSMIYLIPYDIHDKESEVTGYLGSQDAIKKVISEKGYRGKVSLLQAESGDNYYSYRYNEI